MCVVDYISGIGTLASQFHEADTMHLLPVLILALLSAVTAQQRPFYAPSQWDYPGVNPMYLQNTTTSTSTSTTDTPSTSTTTTSRPASRVRPVQPASQPPTGTFNRKRPIESTRRTVTSTGWSKPVKTRPSTRVTTTSRTTTSGEPFVDSYIVNRVRDWPAERQPFWYINREHIRDHINQ